LLDITVEEANVEEREEGGTKGEAVGIIDGAEVEYAWSDPSSSEIDASKP
jgi:hypothetical protein